MRLVALTLGKESELSKQLNGSLVEANYAPTEGWDEGALCDLLYGAEKLRKQKDGSFFEDKDEE